MESINKWPFDVAPDTAVITTKYVAYEGAPILLVTHEYDEDEGIVWQFHCGNEDYRPSVLLLVRLDEILKIDSKLYEIAALPQGFSARRATKDMQWEILNM